MRPYIFSHMMASVDGRIDCPMVAQISGEEYYEALEKFGISSKLSGRVTTALECSAVSGESEHTDDEERPVGTESFYVARRSEEYTITVDTHGRLRWLSDEADGHPLLCIVSENVTEKHLEMLRRQNISWIATGEKRIDLPRAMEILYEQFGVDRLAIVGGGHINGGFLEAGLLDEISVMVAPGIDGRKGQTSVFDGITWHGNAPFSLKLQSIERWENTDVVWLRYKTMPTAQIHTTK